jgi:hypothetical protein
MGRGVNVFLQELYDFVSFVLGGTGANVFLQELYDFVSFVLGKMKLQKLYLHFPEINSLLFRYLTTVRLRVILKVKTSAQKGCGGGREHGGFGFWDFSS